MYMLVDCDNFFVSCELVFQPKLRDRPVVVLSNNDGCVVSRSYEAKKIGIPMCAPYFKIENTLNLHNGVALSSNHELYSDISKRIIRILHEQFKTIEIYSIDEAFVKIDDDINHLKLALDLRNKILKEIGVSVSIGIARSKTLCKIASEIAKKKTSDKVSILTDDEEIDNRLKALDVEDIWGIGKNSAKKFNYLGIFTALELKNAAPSYIRKNFSISTEKTVLELRQFSCIDIEEGGLQQSIIFSRSFEYEINNYTRLKQVISEFVDDACLRLRNQNGMARGIIVNIQTNRFGNNEFYDNSQLVLLNQPTSNTLKFVQAMEKGLKQIYRSDLWYKKAGVVITSIEDISNKQSDFFYNKDNSEKDKKLMQAYDKINAKLGKKSIFIASQISGNKNFVKKEKQSPKFSTSWNELLIVK